MFYVYIYEHSMYVSRIFMYGYVTDILKNLETFLSQKHWHLKIILKNDRSFVIC